jgi:uncharacterized protein (TIGR02145 family)
LLAVGDEYPLAAAVLPANATDKAVAWSSSDPAKATVTDGRILAIAEGSTTITATVGEKTATCAVTVTNTPIGVASISLDKAILALYIGDEYSRKAAVLPANATDKAVAWSSSDPGKVAVTNGKVAALAEGTVTITARAGEKTATCAVTVTSIAVADISLDKATLWLDVGEKSTLKATVLPANATDKAVTWSSSDESIATVSSTGLVTVVSAGIATITATAGGKTATCFVNDGVLISGTIWATRNVDAPGTFAAKPEDAGMFYQWNRKTAWPATGDVSGWDASTPSDDSWAAANDPCPTGWRVPTGVDQQSLLDAGSAWTMKNGVAGRAFGAGAITLFLPAAGYRYNSFGTLYFAGTNGDYWSASESSNSNAYSLYFNSNSTDKGNNSRSLGFSVRCVAE